MFIAQPTDHHPMDQFTTELSAICGRYDFDLAPKRESVWGGVQRRRLNEWDIAMIATDMERAVKTEKAVKQDQSDDFFLILQQYGTACMRQNGKEVLLNPGDLVFIDSSKPSEFIFSGQRSMQISLHLPRLHLDERFGKALVGGKSLSGRSLTSQAVHAMLKKICSDPEETGDADLRRDVLFGLLGLFLEESGAAQGRSETTPDCIVFERANAVIARDFRDGHLSSERIAQHINVSLRSLQRAFSDHDMTVTQAILSARLAYAQNLISNRQEFRHLTTISSIAFDAGFSDVSYFNRRFREAYGCAPSAFWRDGASASSRNATHAKQT